MSENDQKIEYVNAIEEARKLDDLLASLNSRLNSIGASFEGLGEALQGKGSQSLDWHARVFDRPTFEKNSADLPGLLEQYNLTYAKRSELETRLSKFSWHSKKSN